MNKVEQVKELLESITNNIEKIKSIQKEIECVKVELEKFKVDVSNVYGVQIEEKLEKPIKSSLDGIEGEPIMVINFEVCVSGEIKNTDLFYDIKGNGIDNKTSIMYRYIQSCYEYDHIEFINGFVGQYIPDYANRPGKWIIDIQGRSLMIDLNGEEIVVCNDLNIKSIPDPVLPYNDEIASVSLFYRLDNETNKPSLFDSTIITDVDYKAVRKIDRDKHNLSFTDIVNAMPNTNVVELCNTDKPYMKTYTKDVIFTQNISGNMCLSMSHKLSINLDNVHEFNYVKVFDEKGDL